MQRIYAIKGYSEFHVSFHYHNEAETVVELFPCGRERSIILVTGKNKGACDAGFKRLLNSEFTGRDVHLEAVHDVEFQKGIII